MPKNDETSRKEIPAERLWDGEIPHPTKGQIEVPEPSEYTPSGSRFSRIWGRVKHGVVNQAIPYVRKNLDVDLDLGADRTTKTVTGRATISFKGHKLFSIMKSIKL